MNDASDIVARTIWNTYRVLREAGADVAGEYVTEGRHARKNICECGFAILRDEIPLGKTYLILRNSVMDYTLRCEGCHKEKHVRVALCLADESTRKITRMPIDCLDFTVQP